MHSVVLARLIDLALKSDEIVEVLDHFDIPVVYEFDRLNEGMEDTYWASAYDAGFQLRFDQSQVLRTVFAYVLPRDGFSVADASLVGVPFHQTPQEAQREFDSCGVRVEAGNPGHVWLRGFLGDYSVHYEYNGDGDLSLVTLSSNDA